MEHLHSFRMLQLARASRAAFAAKTRFSILRVQELDVLRTIAYEEYEEAQCQLTEADHQIGDVRNILVRSGSALFEEPAEFPLRFSPAPNCSDASDSIPSPRLQPEPC
ncbi:hypothetical protein J3R83DRAFT_10099 [Lanmaoa asiatica]|nr:hypothetical protein J3R83DRAFT_10099 [Lanmaoa asiatica]